MTISTYAKPKGFFNIGLTAGQAWQLPSKSTLSNKLGDYHRRSRRQLYRKMELLLERWVANGKENEGLSLSLSGLSRNLFTPRRLIFAQRRISILPIASPNSSNFSAISWNFLSLIASFVDEEIDLEIPCFRSWQFFNVAERQARDSFQLFLKFEQDRLKTLFAMIFIHLKNFPSEQYSVNKNCWKCEKTLFLESEISMPPPLFLSRRNDVFFNLSIDVLHKFWIREYSIQRLKGWSFRCKSPIVNATEISK